MAALLEYSKTLSGKTPVPAAHHKKNQTLNPKSNPK
jgi:hypothetical protein